MAKRQKYISWDDYFMAIALISAHRSKDPHNQIGACIVDPNKRIVGVGYNGFPIGCHDDHLPWEKGSEKASETKFPYVIHAEVNAVLNSNVKLNNCSIYIKLFPCCECAKIIIQSGIREVVYVSDEDAHKETTIAAKRMFNLSGVKFRQFSPSLRLDVQY